jgi:O-antigen/teichoic acid export membrane protein
MKKPWEEDNARAQAFYGAFWTFFGFGGSQVLRLAGNLILARLLFPEAFGLMALVNIFMQGLQAFSDLGIGPAIIQNPEGETPAFRRVAWTVQILRGFLLWGVACLLAWPAARFYSVGHPDAMLLLQILPIIGFTAALGGFTSTSLYVMNRRMKIGAVTLLELGPQLVSIVIMVLYALFVDRSVWAMVAGSFGHSVTRLALSHLIERGHRDRIGWDRETASELIRFGGWILASTIATFLVVNLDRLILGRLLSLAELGIYSIAMTFAQLGMQITTRLTNIVLFPLLTRWQHRPDRLMRLCLRGRRLVLLAGGSVCVAFALIAPLFFELLYDPRYHEAGPLSRWLSIYIWCWIMVATLDRVPLATGQTRTLFLMNLFNVFAIGLVIPGYRGFGLPGFVLALAAAQLLALAFLTWRLPGDRLRAALQSAGLSAGFGLYGLAGVSLLRLVPGENLVARIVCSGLAAAPPALLAAGSILLEMKRKEASE